MRIAVIGAGRVGRALGRRWAECGHDVVYGVREPGGQRHADLPTRSPAEAVAGAQVVLLAVPWGTVQQVAEDLDVGQAVVLDATNPLPPGSLAEAGGLSGAELVSRWLGSQRVVKAFNTTGSGNMLDPDYPGGSAAMFVAGDEAAAKATAIDLAEQIGFAGIDAGPLTAAADLEHLAMMWVRLAYQMGNGPDIAFALLRRHPGKGSPSGGS